MAQNSSFLEVLRFDGTEYILDKDYIHSLDNSIDLFAKVQHGQAVYISSDELLAFVVDSEWDRIVYGDFDKWVKSYGSFGVGTGQFAHPYSISTDGNYNIYVADTHNGRLVKLQYDPIAKEISSGSFTPLAASILQMPWDIDIDDRGTPSSSDDYLWVVDKMTSSIFKLSADGALLGNVTSLYNVSTNTTYSDLSGINSISIRKNPSTGRNSTSNRRLYLVDGKLSKAFLVEADANSNGQYLVYKELSISGNTNLQDIESDFFGDVWLVDKNGSRAIKYTWDLNYLDEIGGFNYPLSISSSKQHHLYMAVTEEWSNSTGIRTYTHGAHVNDLYVNPGKTFTYFNFKATNYGRIVLKVFYNTTEIFSQYIGFYDGIYPSGQQSGYVWQSSPQPGDYTLKIWAYVYNDTSKFHYVEQDFQFLTDWPADLTLANMSIGGEQVYTATNSITAGPNFTVASSGDVTFRSNGTITLKPGFRAVEGSAFRAYTSGGSFPKSTSGPLAAGDDSTAANDGASDDPALPSVYALHHAYPNPFNPTVTIRYELPEPAEVRLIVYNLLGREVVRLAEGHMAPGYHAAVWHGRDATGRPVPSGLYIARLVTPKYVKSIKMILLK